MKSSAERAIEALTWASVVIWLGFALVAGILDYAFLIIMVLGIIMLSSAIYQRSRGWHTSLSLWIFGIWMAVFSVLETVSALLGASGEDGESGLNIGLEVYLGVALVSMGVAVVLRSINSPGALSGSNGGGASSSGSTGSGAPAIPHPVNDDHSHGYVPPYGSTSTGNEPTGWGNTGGYGASAAAWPPPGQGPAYGSAGGGDPYGGGQYGGGSFSEEPTYNTRWDNPGPQPEYGGPAGPGGSGGGYGDAPPRDPYANNPYGSDPHSSEPYANNPYGSDPYSQDPYGSGSAGGQGWDAPPPGGTSGGGQYGGGDPYADPYGGQGGGWGQPQRSQPRNVRPRSRPGSAPSDLESRVEDIIRRSRERRNQQADDFPADEDLPY